MFRIAFVFFTVLPLMTSAFAADVLQSGGKAAYVIGIPKQPHPTESRAAKELATYLKKVSGADFSILTEDQIHGLPAIYVGQTKRAAQEANLAEFHPEEWFIRTTADGSLILTGGKYAGIFYAVVDYLERQCGIRWLDETCEVVPRNPQLGIGKWDLRRKPSFALRQVFDMLDWSPTTGTFKERNKGFSYTQQETGVSKYYGGNRPYHSAGDYASDWPRDKAELFSRDANDNPMIPVKEGDAGGQICMSNPEARQRVLDKMLAYIGRDRKEAAEKQCAPPLIYDFSGNDNPHKCTCSGCMELANREGSYSGATIDFINWIARRIAREHPEIMVKTFAYMYCEEPPKFLHAEPNVMIHIALGGVEFGGAYYMYDTMRALTHPVNKRVLARFKDWGRHANHLMIWQYWTLYPIIPEPTVHVDALFSDIETFKECHVEAFFAEYENPAFNSFSVLTRWLAFKLTDDANADKQKLLQEFMTGYYGPAAPHMIALLKYMEKRQADFDGAIGTVDVCWRGYLDNEYFATTLGFLRKAEEEAKGSQEIVDRVRLELPCLLAGLLSRWPYLKDTSPYNAEALIEEFRTEACKSMDRFFKEDQQNFRKSQGFDQKVETFCLNFRMETAGTHGSLPEGVVLDANTSFISLGAGRFLHEAKAKIVDDPDAFGGKASCYEHGNENLNLFLSNWMEGITLSKFNLTEQILPRDGKYHWVEVGLVRFSNNGRAHLLIPDHCQGIRCDFFRKVLPGTSYQVYISLKCDSKAICADRVLMVKTENASEEGVFTLPPEIEAKKHTIVPAGRFHSPGNASLQADPAAFGGSAWVNRTPACTNVVNTDFGIFDSGSRECTAIGYPRGSILDENYHLIKVATMKLPVKKGSYVYCGSDWQIQCPLPDEMLGKQGTLYVLAKFTGFVYVSSSKEKNGLHIGGLVFVE